MRVISAMIVAAALAVTGVSAQELGVLAPTNLSKPRPKPPFTVTGTWFIDHHHWIDSGIPASDALHIVERVKLVGQNGTKMQIEYTMTDPKSWEGEWKVTKQWNRVDARDMEIAEVECLPDLNSHIPSTQSKENVR